MTIETNTDRLKEADVMFVCLAPFNGLSSRFIYGAVDAIAKAHQNNCALVFYVTDWQINLIMSSARTMLNGNWRWTKSLLSARADFLWAVHHEAQLLKVVEAFVDRPWPETIVPLHTWWDDPGRDSDRIRKHIPTRRLCALDPTAITTDTWDIEPPVWSEKKRQWVSAALSKRARWIEDRGITWPSEIRGESTFNIRDGKAAPRVSEREVIDLYRQSWGAVSPPTNMSKTGWWRTRYSYALRSGAILYGLPDEVSPMGDNFGYSVQQIESFSDSELRDLAEAQRAQFESKVEPKEQVLTKLSDCVQRAIGDIK